MSQDSLDSPVTESRHNSVIEKQKDDEVTAYRIDSNSDDSTTTSPMDEHCESKDDDYKVTRRTLAAMLAMAMTYAAMTSCLVTPTTIAHQVEAVGGTLVSSWIANAQNVVAFATTAIMGSIGDHIGKRNLLLAGLTAEFVGALVASRASQIGQIIAGQALLGFASALLALVQPASMEIVPAKKRPLVSIFLVIFLVCSNVICIFIFAACIKYDSSGGQGWRWTYYVPAIISFPSFFMIWFWYRPPLPRMHRGKSHLQALKDLDITGMFLLLAGSLLLIIGLSWGGGQYAWKSSRVISFIVIGVVLWIGFGLWDWKATKTGLLNHRLFSINRNFSLILAVSFIDGMIINGTAAYMPQEIAALFTTDPIEQVVPLVIAALTLMVGGFGSAYYLYIFKGFRTILTTGCLWLGAWVGACAAIAPGRQWMIYLGPAMYGIGLGMTTGIPALIMAYSVPSDLLGTALTIVQTMRTFGGVIGVTIFSSVLINKETYYLSNTVAPAAIQAGIPATTVPSFLKAASAGVDNTTLLTLPGVTVRSLAVVLPVLRDAIAAAYHWVWIAIAPFCIATALLIPFLVPVRERMTNHVESKLEDEAVTSTEDGGVRSA